MSGEANSERSGLDAKIEAIEYEYIVDALKNSGGNMTEAAALGMSRRILGLRLKKHRIEPRNFRQTLDLAKNKP